MLMSLLIIWPNPTTEALTNHKHNSLHDDNHILVNLLLLILFLFILF